jgi:hypothetical protein
VDINRTAILVLEEGGQGLEDYFRAKNEFKEEFEADLEEKQRDFERKAGKPRVDAGKQLLVFIAEKWAQWRALIMPAEGTFKGVFSQDVRVGSFATVKTEADMVLTLSNIRANQEQEFLYAEARGSSLNGTGSATLNMAALFPFAAGGVQGELVWEGEFQGTARGTVCIAEHRITDNRGDFDVGFSFMNMVGAAGSYQIDNGEVSGDLDIWTPVAFAHTTTSGSRITGEVIFYAPQSGVYMVEPINETTEPGSSQKETFHFYAVGWDDEKIEFQQILDQQFINYVDAIERYNDQQYSGVSNPVTKETRAREALARLYTAETTAQQFGVLESAVNAAGLRKEDPTSLYDTWFKKWFRSGDEAWISRIDRSTSVQAEINNRYGRFRHYLNGAQEIMLGLYASQTAEQLHLLLPNSAVDRIYLDYFDVTLEAMCTDLAEGIIDEAAFLEWKQLETAGIMGAVSNSVLTEVVHASCPATP